MKKSSTKKAKKNLNKPKQIKVNFFEKLKIGTIVMFFIAVIGSIITVLSLKKTIYYGEKTATKEDTKNIQIEVDKTATKEDIKKIQINIDKINEELHSFRDGFAENTSSDEPLRKKMEKADSLLNQGECKQAYNLYAQINNQALSSGKEKLFVLSLMGKGISIGVQGDYQEAIRILKNAEDYKDVLDDNAKGKLYFNLGLCNQMLRNNYIAIEYYSKILNLSPDDVEAYLIRGAAYVYKGEHDRAIQDFNKAIELDSKYTEAYLIRGAAYVYKGEHDRAAQDFNKAIELDSEYAEIYYIRGLAYGYKGDHDRAIQDFNKAIELDSEYAEAYFNRGMAYGYKGEHDRAAQDFNKAIELDSAFAVAYFNPNIKNKLTTQNKE